MAGRPPAVRARAPVRRALTAAQAVAAVAVAGRLARGRERRPPLAPGDGRGGDGLTVSVVIPARDEAWRIGPCLAGVMADGDAREVIVVDDCSADATGEIARGAGARVVQGREPPAGWIGKPWALQQGLEAASGDVVVSLDADTRPRPGLLRALAGALEEADLVTAGARFVCDGRLERLIHASMLASLVYRYGPADALAPRSPARVVSNGQCTAVRRRQLLAAGGYRAAAGHMTDDAALARALARAGWRIAFVDGGDLLQVKMHDSAGEVWREWGRSLAMPDVTAPLWQAADLAVVWLAMALPLARAAAGRAGRLDAALLAARLALVAALRRSYAPAGPPVWLSPLADGAVAARLTLSALRPSRRWRGRTYARAAGPRRTGRR